MKSPKCKKGKPSSFEGFPLITIHNFAESLGQVPARDPFAAPFYLSENSLMRCSSSSLQMSRWSSFSATI